MSCLYLSFFLFFWGGGGALHLLCLPRRPENKIGTLISHACLGHVYKHNQAGNLTAATPFIVLRVEITADGDAVNPVLSVSKLKVKPTTLFLPTFV